MGAFDYLIGALLAIPILNLLLDSVPITTVDVSGRSMQPTIQAKETWRCLLTQTIDRGDVVLLYSPSGDSSKLFVKRVIAKEGDLLLKTRHPSALSGLPEVVWIPKGHIWVEGDNGACSSDSNDFGPIPHSLVLGRFILRTSPQPWKFLPDALPIGTHRVIPGYQSPSYVNRWRLRHQRPPPIEQFSSEFVLALSKKKAHRQHQEENSE